MTPRTAKVASSSNVDEAHLKHKRRFCRQEGCNRIVKSQGLCQRHGAKPRKCKVEGCDKQAQGNFDKMCKSHFKAMKRVTTPLPRVPQGKTPPTPQGFSVYDGILPASIAYQSRKGTVMPLIAHLKEGFVSNKPPAWHRNEERSSRGIFPVENPATQLEGWERELVWMEILVLTGAPGVSFRHLARAWGRDKGFHTVLAQFICERQGDVQRKKRLAEEKEQLSSAITAAGKSRGPAKKRRRLKKNANLAADVSADIWDDSAYGDHVTNEALAADIFDFSPKEFESATALQRWKHMEDHSDSASMTSQRSMNSHAVAVAMVEHSGKIMPKPSSAKNGLVANEHPEQNPETSALVLTSDANRAQTFAGPPSDRPTGPMDSHGQQSHQQHYQQPHYDASTNQQQGHQQQYGANAQVSTGQPQYEQNQPQYDSNSHQPQGQQGHQPQYGQNQTHYDTSGHQSGQQGHQLGYVQNHSVHQQTEQFHDAQQQLQPEYNGGGAQQQQPQVHYRAESQQQPQYQQESHQTVQQPHYGQNHQPHQVEMVNHGPSSAVAPNQELQQYPQGSSQGQYMPPANIQNQTHYEPAQQQQPYPQQHEQHGQYVSQGQESQQQHNLGAPSHQQREHPEQDPETSALPPELAHPQGHHQQYQQPPPQQNEGGGGYNTGV